VLASPKIIIYSLTAPERRSQIDILLEVAQTCLYHYGYFAGRSTPPSCF
jgi:hypothetical protein